MEPFYFGQSRSRLFGIFYPAQGNSSARQLGVVMCYPMGQEYLFGHRSYVLLSKRLASLGLNVLRFDFYGCGDSDGDTTEGSLRRWQDDVSVAVDELKGGCALDSIYLMGSRLGASTALLAGAERGDIDGIILWDPVVDGRSYIDESLRIHRHWLRSSFAKCTPKCEPEILGFPLTDTLSDELNGMNLLELQKNPAGNVLIIESQDTKMARQLLSHLSAIGANVSYKQAPAKEPWNNQAGPESVHQVYEYMSAWIQETST